MRQNHILFSASNKSNVWTFDAEDHVFNDTHHPMESKAAVVYLRRNGELKLRFQQADNSWHEVATQLGLIVSTREAFTHAAFASNGGASNVHSQHGRH
jgi:mediator of RNA polymerase II transcription subunit 16